MGVHIGATPPPGEYDGMIYAAAVMPAVAAITAATE